MSVLLAVLRERVESYDGCSTKQKELGLGRHSHPADQRLRFEGSTMYD